MRSIARKPWLGVLVAGALTALFVSVGCSKNDDEVSLAILAASCTINSDCVSPLVCAFQLCHDACESSADCPTGERCMLSDRPFHVCQLPDEKACTYNSQCPSGQVCAVDDECRDMCASNKDCVMNQVCVSATCADPVELVNGRLPVAPNGSGADAATSVGETTCIHNSDCPGVLVCLHGLCGPQCLADKDCTPGLTCSNSLCVDPSTLDAGTDASSSSTDASQVSDGATSDTSTGDAE